MNTYKSIFNIGVISLILSVNTLSFGMMAKYKSAEARSALSNSTKLCSQIDKERKELEALPFGEQMRRHLETLETLYIYQNNPRFVTNFLFIHRAPVLFLDAYSPRDDNKRDYFYINPYEASFYQDNRRPFLGNKKIHALGRQRLDEALQQKLENEQKENVVGDRVYRCNTLINSILFGTDQHIIKEIDNAYCHEDLYVAASAAIHYPHTKNNALELLCSKIKKDIKKIESDQLRWDRGYTLLWASAQSKEAFKLIANKDPYNINRVIRQWDNGDQATILEEMLADEDFFNQEHIDIFRRDGFGMTTQEVIIMDFIGRIENKEETSEEEALREFWESRIGMGKILNEYI